MKSFYSSKNPNYKNNIRLLIEEKNPSVKFIDAQLIRKSGKSRMIVWMIDENEHEFSKTLEKIKSDKYLCCSKCARKMRDNLVFKKREKDWLKKIKESNYTLLSIPEHITTDSIVEVEDKMGYKYTANARSVKQNRNLLTFSKYNNKKYLHYNLCHYKDLNNLLSTPIQLSSKRNKDHIYYEFECICGKHFERSINKWMMGKDLCNSCTFKESTYERMVRTYLEENCLEYKQEFTIYECRDINPLPFDFWLKKYNCLIEVDGQQHFKAVDYGCGEEMANARFIAQQKRDKIKDEYCKKYNIPLLHIPYWEFDNGNWIEHIKLFLNSLRINDS